MADTITIPKKRKRLLVCVAACLIVAFLLLLLAATLHEAERTDLLRITAKCDGWTSDVLAPCVFVSGTTDDGGGFDEMASVAPGETTEVNLASNNYTVTPRYPYLMLADGTIMQARIDMSHSGDTAGATECVLEYARADTSALDYEKLAAIADESLMNAALSTKNAALAAAQDEWRRGNNA